MTSTAPQWVDLARAVDESGGAFTTTMKVLRMMAGARRSSPSILDEISAELQRRGYGHRPEALPVRQEDHVMVFRLGTLGADVFNALENAMTGGNISALAEAIKMINAANETAGQERLETLLDMSPVRPRRRSKENRS